MKAFKVTFAYEYEIVVVSEDESCAKQVSRDAFYSEFDQSKIEDSIQIEPLSYMPYGWEMGDYVYGEQMTLKEALLLSPEYAIENERRRDNRIGQMYIRDWLDRK